MTGKRLIKFFTILNRKGRLIGLKQKTWRNLLSFVGDKNAFFLRKLVWSQNVEVKNRTLLDSLLVLSGQQLDTVEVHLTKIHQIFWEDVSLDWSTRTTTGHIMDTKWTSWGQALKKRNCSIPYPFWLWGNPCPHFCENSY